MQYYLYRSGILDIKVYFEQEDIYISERDLSNHQWSNREHLTEEKYKAIKSYYLLDLKRVQQILTVDNEQFLNIERKNFELNDGSKYEKNLVSDQIWAERYRKNPLDVQVCENKIIAFIVTSRENTVVLVTPGEE